MQRPSGQKQAPPPHGDRGRRGGRGRGGGCNPRFGPACSPGTRSSGPGQASRGPQPDRSHPASLPLTEMQRLRPRFPPGRPAMAPPPPPPPPPRSPHSLFHRPRPAAEERTGSGTPIGCGPHSRQPPRPEPQDVTGWRSASLPRLVLIGCLEAPNQQDRSPASPLRPPTPQHRFHPGGRGRDGRRWNASRQWERQERTGGSARGGKFSQWACVHILGSGAPSLAAHVPAGRAQGHARLSVARKGRPLE